MAMAEKMLAEFALNGRRQQGRFFGSWIASGCSPWHGGAWLVDDASLTLSGAWLGFDWLGSWKTGSAFALHYSAGHIRYAGAATSECSFFTALRELRSVFGGI